MTMSKSAFYHCARAGIEQLESTSYISKGNAMEHREKATSLLPYHNKKGLFP